jgi:hypothetical protein
MALTVLKTFEGHLASAPIEDHMIIVLDLRGWGLSAKPEGGYDKKRKLRMSWVFWMPRESVLSNW